MSVKHAKRPTIKLCLRAFRGSLNGDGDVLDVVGFGATRSNLKGLDLPEVFAHGIQSRLGKPEEQRGFHAEVVAFVSRRIVLYAALLLQHIV